MPESLRCNDRVRRSLRRCRESPVSSQERSGVRDAAVRSFIPLRNFEGYLLTTGDPDNFRTPVPPQPFSDQAERSRSPKPSPARFRATTRSCARAGVSAFRYRGTDNMHREV